MNEQVKELACELCELHNKTTCTTPIPDPEHWICKKWLEKAQALIDSGWRNVDTTLTEVEIDHIEKGLKKFYKKEWCSVCDNIAKKLKFEPPEDETAGQKAINS